MLLRLGLLCLCLYAGAFKSHAQIAIADVKQLANVAQFDGTDAEFMKLLAGNVRYPMVQQSSNQAGTVVGVLKIARSGDIVEVGSLNTSNKDFKNEIKRVAQLTKGKWLPSNDTAAFFYAVIPIQFKYHGKEYDLDNTTKPEYFKGAILLTAIGGNSSLGRVTSELEQEYVASANMSMKAGRKKESIKYLERLINLQPFYVGYYNGIISLYEETGQTDKAEYYKAVRDVLVARKNE